MNDPRAAGIEHVARKTVYGFRLKRLEVLNWGTFDGCVWTLDLDGRNGLLTGDIGPGQSALVDALATLLVPGWPVAHNTAAGADDRERTLRPDALDHGISDRSAGKGTARPVGLRDTNAHSVILGVFRNESSDQTVTLAQVFRMKEPQALPARFFVGAERELSIAEHFTPVGDEVSPLRRRLRGLDCDVEDGFPEYGAWFRRRFGIENAQALELFGRTVSMKSVGNLTDFVRNHVLEPFDVAPHAQALIDRFDALNRAREAVLQVRHRAELLAPLVDDSNRHAELGHEIAALRDCREGLRAHFARMKSALIDDRLARLENVYERLNVQIERLETRRDDRRNQVDELMRAVAGNGGDRIERLGAEIRKLEALRDTRRLRSERYGALAKRIGEVAAGDETTFITQRMRLKRLRNETRDRDAVLESELTDHHVAWRQVKDDHDALRDEIDILRCRRSNIDVHRLRTRASMCEALGMAEEVLPFAGELLQVRDDEREWEGAAERLLRAFGLSLLVPDAYEKEVAAWIERNHLGGRLVCVHVSAVRRDELPDLHRDSLVRKLSIKSDSAFRDWMERELADRFDVACCASQEQFQAEARAISRTGEIKDRSGRREKDDRYGIDDRTRYVLGWSNAAKIDALESRRKLLEGHMGEISARIAKVQDQRKLIGERLDALVRLEEFVEFEELDWNSLAKEIQSLSEERKRLESASDILQHLKGRLSQSLQGLAATQNELDVAKDRRSRIQQRKADAGEMRRLLQAVIEQDAVRVRLLSPEELARRLDAARMEALGRDVQPSVEACDHHEQETRAHLQKRIDTEEGRLMRRRDRIIRALTVFELDASAFGGNIEAAHECRNLLERLRDDDLPRFEARFEALLDETINEIANFGAQLARSCEAIRESIARINDSLTKIDYEPGRYLVLEAQPSLGAAIRDFQSGLCAFVEGAPTDSEDAQCPEAKFLQAKSFIDRLCACDGASDQARRGVARVTDVRDWFVFAASERWRADDSEYEPSVDSDGKSGERKEKLAYTVLAASLACQFGLEREEARSFRFVLIDEAFGRGTDESAQFGLRLFRQLALQSLIVTPLQKIHVIEPYVATVGFVHNGDGRSSTLRNLTIDEYRAQHPAPETLGSATVEASG